VQKNRQGPKAIVIPMVNNSIRLTILSTL